MGESELVLDGMPVEDVLSMLGVMRGGAPLKTAPRPRAVDDTREQPSVDGGREAPSPAAETETPALPPAAYAPPPPPALREEVGPEPRVISTDWREALRESDPAMAARPVAEPAAPLLDLGAADTAPAWLVDLGITLGISAGRGTVASMDLGIASLPTLEEIADATRACTRCDLHRTATNAVPGEGDPNADFVCVGEAPGQNEDEQGRPFVGAAGNLLNKILAAISLQREQVFICNVLKHRPPGNRDPLPDEVRACEPYLRRQLELVKPRVILALGRFAAQSLLQTTTPIGKLRGAIHRYHGIPLIVTYHPAALLRNEAWKRPTWEDVKLARRVLDASRAASGSDAAQR